MRTIAIKGIGYITPHIAPMGNHNHAIKEWERVNHHKKKYHAPEFYYDVIQKSSGVVELRRHILFAPKKGEEVIGSNLTLTDAKRLQSELINKIKNF